MCLNLKEKLELKTYPAKIPILPRFGTGTSTGI